MGRPVVHWELTSKDRAKVADFYSKIFDWTIEVMPHMNYHMVNTGDKIHVEAQDVPGMGAFCLFTDPEGRMMGLWQSASM